MNKKHILWVAVAGVLVAAGLITAQLFGASQRGAAGVPGEPGSAYWEGLPVAGMTIGAQDAPVLVEEYFDFQCPYCQQMSDEIVKPFIEQVVSKGEARFAYRLYPFLGPESLIAARGAYCAATQGKFWPFQAILFAQRGVGNQGTYSEARLRTYAEAAGLDLAAYDACMASQDAAIFAAGSVQRGVQMGLPGTPVFFVNGQPVAVRTLSDLLRAVEEAKP